VEFTRGFVRKLSITRFTSPYFLLNRISLYVRSGVATRDKVAFATAFRTAIRRRPYRAPAFVVLLIAECFRYVGSSTDFIDSILGHVLHGLEILLKGRDVQESFFDRDWPILLRPRGTFACHVFSNSFA
jgi:hypothetical protein